jgi:hypothetical protein
MIEKYLKRGIIAIGSLATILVIAFVVVAIVNANISAPLECKTFIISDAAGEALFLSNKSFKTYHNVRYEINKGKFQYHSKRHLGPNDEDPKTHKPSNESANIIDLGEFADSEGNRFDFKRYKLIDLTVFCDEGTATYSNLEIKGKN